MSFACMSSVCALFIISFFVVWWLVGIIIGCYYDFFTPHLNKHHCPHMRFWILGPFGFSKLIRRLYVCQECFSWWEWKQIKDREQTQ